MLYSKLVLQVMCCTATVPPCTGWCQGWYIVLRGYCTIRYCTALYSRKPNHANCISTLCYFKEFLRIMHSCILLNRIWVVRAARKALHTLIWMMFDTPPQGLKGSPGVSLLVDCGCAGLGVADLLHRSCRALPLLKFWTAEPCMPGWLARWRESFGPLLRMVGCWRSW